MNMLTKSLVFGVLLALASVTTTVQADSYLHYRHPSVGLNIGSNGAGLHFNNGRFGRKHYSGNRFKGQRINRGINRGRLNGYRGQRFLNNRGNFNRGRRDLSDNRLGDYRRYP